LIAAIGVVALAVPAAGATDTASGVSSDATTTAATIARDVAQVQGALGPLRERAAAVDGQWRSSGASTVIDPVGDAPLPEGDLTSASASLGTTVQLSASVASFTDPHAGEWVTSHAGKGTSLGWGLGSSPNSLLPTYVAVYGQYGYAVVRVSDRVVTCQGAGSASPAGRSYGAGFDATCIGSPTEVYWASVLTYSTATVLSQDAAPQGASDTSKVCASTADPAVGTIPVPTLSKFVPLAPTRLFDTRTSSPGILCGGETRVVQVAGHAGVPANATAVALNVTGTQSGGAGFITVWNTGLPRQSPSNLNFTAPGQTRANLVIAPIGADGSLSFYSSLTVHLIADVAGYFVATPATSDGRLTSLNPTRLLDTRLGIGAPIAKPEAGATVDLQVTGRGDVPSAGVSAVVLNVTAADATEAGYVTVWPAGQARPNASSLNLVGAGDTAPNLVMVPVGASGNVSLFTETGTHLIADVVGWFGDASQPAATAGRFLPLIAQRVFDTRPTPLAAGDVTSRPHVGVAGIPSTGIAAVLLNVTGVDATAGGYVTVWPTGVPQPVASTLNLAQPGDARANATITPIGTNGEISFFTERGGNLLSDAFGYFVS
jgi:hypothetical protein